MTEQIDYLRVFRNVEAAIKQARFLSTREFKLAVVGPQALVPWNRLRWLLGTAATVVSEGVDHSWVYDKRRREFNQCPRPWTGTHHV